VPLGWRDDVPELMAAADVLVHNAGGLSVTEALVVGLPTLTYLPIPGHGRANAAVLERAGVAAWPRDPQQLHEAIERLHSAPTATVPAWPADVDAAATVARALAANRLPLARVSGF
jgi:UDP-N-acetylglucosamine:LPS N-acetylglucosamine transferase